MDCTLLRAMLVCCSSSGSCMRAWRRPTSRTAGCCPALPNAIAALVPPLRSYPTTWTYKQPTGLRQQGAVWLTVLWTGILRSYTTVWTHFFTFRIQTARGSLAVCTVHRDSHIVHHNLETQTTCKTLIDLTHMTGSAPWQEADRCSNTVIGCFAHLLKKK